MSCPIGRDVPGHGRLGRVWAVLAVAGAVVVLTGWLPASQAHDVAVTRAAPVLGFLVAITVLSGLAERAGVFDAAAGTCARLARGSTPRLFLLIAGLGTLITVGMSIDTTAVLLTPVVLTLAEKLDLPATPFALLAVWLANTASLLLPVSNLTNLLAVQHLDLSAVEFARRMALPEVVAVLVSVAWLGFLYRGQLRRAYEPPERTPPPDRWTFGVCALACLALAPGVLAGVPPWVIGLPCAAAAVLVFAVRDRTTLTWNLLPWRIVVLTEGLFLVVSGLARHGGTRLLADLMGHSTLASTVVAGGAGNLVNNLPAYLAVETAVPGHGTTQLLAALIGTNAGPLILLWGSLATLLWRERCRARGVVVPARTFALIGLGGVPLVLLSAWATLLLTT